MLLHQPFCDRYGAYRDLEKAYKAEKVRAIGVSNFFPDHFIDLASNMEIAPMVNQMEMHVFNQQHETRKFMDFSLIITTFVKSKLLKNGTKKKHCARRLTVRDVKIAC